MLMPVTVPISDVCTDTDYNYCYQCIHSDQALDWKKKSSSRDYEYNDMEFYKTSGTGTIT